MVKILTAIGIFLGLLFVIWLFLPEDSSTEYSTYENDENMPIKRPVLYFYDNKTNCSLNGEIYSGSQFIGNVQDGKIELKEEDYNKTDSNELFYILGETDSCFLNDKGLPFYRAWTFVDWDYLFETGGSEEFILDLNPRWPMYPKEMQGFIHPEQVEDILQGIKDSRPNLSNTEMIEKLGNYAYMNWASDRGLFGSSEYWQTPNDFEKNRAGDCEDWAIYTLSLIEAYDNNLNCYAALWDSHVNIICRIDKTFIIFDQNKIKRSVNLNEDFSISENEKKLRSWVNNYFESFGLKPDERKLYSLFNSKEYIEFEDNSDFFEWALKTTWLL